MTSEAELGKPEEPCGTPRYVEKVVTFVDGTEFRIGGFPDDLGVYLDGNEIYGA